MVNIFSFVNQMHNETVQETADLICKRFNLAFSLSFCFITRLYVLSYKSCFKIRWTDELV